MTYVPSGNPATGSEALSALIRAEFASISAAFTLLPRVTTTGNFDTIFAQVGSFTFILPGAAGTLATTANVTTAVATETAARTAAVSAEATTRAAAATTEATARAAADTVNATAISDEATARAAADALLAPKVSPPLTGTPTAPTAAPGTNTTQIATTAFNAAAIAVLTGVTWHNVTGSRVLTTTYTNSNAYPISVMVTTGTGGGGGGALLLVTVGGVVISAGQSAAIAGNYNTYFQVPAGQTYAVGGGGTMSSWFEMY